MMGYFCGYSAVKSVLGSNRQKQKQVGKMLKICKTDPVGPSPKVDIPEEMQVRNTRRTRVRGLPLRRKVSTELLEKLLLYPGVLMIDFVGDDPGFRSSAALRI